ncbi:dethiobiotin synthase [Polynucleobacter sp. MWH-Creno-3A4]|nr:dethiobiotin synthase [Polynucleobacter sp. MWH-Creno-3A4]
MSNRMNFFVTGSDTEVGKTLVSGALIVKLRDQGINAIGFKPVVAGTFKNSNGQVLNEDLETLRLASRLSPGDLTLCPYVLDAPAAPHLVAAKDNLRLEMQTIMQALHVVQKQCDYVVVEGAGGLLTPINDQEDLGDFAQQLGFPVILVVGMKLGCINHALLTLEAIQSRKLTIAGWIANSPLIEMPFLNENIQTLQSRIHAPFLGNIPTLPKDLQKLQNQPYSIEALNFAAQHIRLPAP